MDKTETFLAHYGGQFSLFPPDETDVWTAEDIHELRCGLMKVSLQQLFDGRESPESRAETLAWLLDDEDAPFSAARCCQAAGADRGIQPNIHALREIILDKLERQAPMPRVRPLATGRDGCTATTDQEVLWTEEEAAYA